MARGRIRYLFSPGSSRNPFLCFRYVHLAVNDTPRPHAYLFCLLFRRTHPAISVFATQPAALALPYLNEPNNYNNGTLNIATFSINSSIPFATSSTAQQSNQTETFFDMVTQRQKGSVRVSKVVQHVAFDGPQAHMTLTGDLAHGLIRL